MSLTTQQVDRMAAIGNNMFSWGPADDSQRLKYPIVGEVIDVNGDWWDVRDVRDTRHGFDLCFGTPGNDHGAYRGGPPRLIATKPLWDFWEANQAKGHGFLYDLPAGRSTITRVRKRLGLGVETGRKR
jgi:hypothetical protein